MELTSRDQIILTALQSNARITNSELAERVNLSASGVQKRVKRLEAAGYISRAVSILNREKLGLHMLCYVDVIMKGHEPAELEKFADIVQISPEILECHRLTGSTDYLLKVLVRDRDHLDKLLMDELMPLPTVERLLTRVVLREVKETTDILLSPPAPDIEQD